MALWPHTVRQKHSKAIRKVICNSSVVEFLVSPRISKKCSSPFSPRQNLPQFFFLAIISCLGGVQPGDQLLNVDGTSLLGLSVEHAQEELNKAMNRETVSCLIDA